MSGADRLFSSPVVDEIPFDNYQTSVGITLQFDPGNGDYCNDLNIKWYQDDTLLFDKDFTPNASIYFCQQNVENYNKIIITFKSMNKPYRFLKFQVIDYGVVRTFEKEELQSIKILEEASLTSEELRINTLNILLRSLSNIDFMFQKKQPIKIEANSNLLGVFFIDRAIRKASNVYEIEAIDYVGLLDKLIFPGATYSNTLVSTLVAAIMGNIPYQLDSTLGAKTLSGTLERCTCREALLQVAFAICGVVDTSRSSVVKIFTPSSTTVGTLGKDKIYKAGNSFENDDIVTEIRIMQNDGTTIVSKKNPVLTADALENILEFEGVFIDSTNANDVVNFLYDFYVTNKNNKSKMKFIVANNEKVGDVINYETEYLDTKKGQIESLSYGLNSNSIVAEATIKELEVA
jgi:hypothetical protein